MGMISDTDYVTVNAVKNIASKPPRKDLEVGYKNLDWHGTLNVCRAIACKVLLGQKRTASAGVLCLQARLWRDAFVSDIHQGTSRQGKSADGGGAQEAGYQSGKPSKLISF